MPPEVEAIDRLLAVPPARFVEERNRLAAELKAAGRAAESAELKKLGRPPASVFGANQAVRRAPDAARRLLDAAERLRKAQAGGGPGSEAFRQAQAAQGEAVDRLLAEARGALEEAGLAASPAVLEKIASNLRWGAFAPHTRELVERGRLARDVPPPGFEVLAGEDVAEAAAAGAAAAAPAKGREPGGGAQRAAERSRAEREARERRPSKRPTARGARPSSAAVTPRRIGRRRERRRTRPRARRTRPRGRRRRRPRRSPARGRS